MNCKETRKAFVALLDGDLALTERAPVEVHVDQCVGCWARLERLRRQPVLLRTMWRARVALSSPDSLLDAVTRLRRHMFYRAPSRVIPMAAAVTVMVVVATYGIQRWTEPAAAPEASPVRNTPAPSIRPPLAATESPAASAMPQLAPAPEPSEAPAAEVRPEPGRQSRERSRPAARAQVASPARGKVSVGASAPEAQSGTVWALGSSKDEQNALPEPEPVRRDRD
jgi:hypothetical protein